MGVSHATTIGPNREQADADVTKQIRATAAPFVAFARAAAEKARRAW
jgi:hypothetical protein